MSFFQGPSTGVFVLGGVLVLFGIRIVARKEIYMPLGFLFLFGMVLWILFGITPTAATTAATTAVAAVTARGCRMTAAVGKTQQGVVLLLVQTVTIFVLLFLLLLVLLNVGGWGWLFAWNGFASVVVVVAAASLFGGDGGCFLGLLLWGVLDHSPHGFVGTIHQWKYHGTIGGTAKNGQGGMESNFGSTSSLFLCLLLNVTRSLLQGGPNLRCHHQGTQQPGHGNRRGLWL